MTRKVQRMLRPLAAGLLAAVVAGCTTSPAPGRPAAESEALRLRLRSAPDGARPDGPGGAAAGGGRGAASTTGAGGAAAMLFPGLPLPQEFDDAAALRDVYFDFDRTTLRPEDARVLDRNARWLKAHPGTLLLIEGHADDRGTSEYNLALAESRAKVTRDQLVARGVAPSRITTVSYGEERPACRDRAEGCWAQNRRAHFLVKSAVAGNTIVP